MKKIFLILIVLFSTSIVKSEEMNVLIDNVSGEVISTIPVSENWEPNDNELRNMHVVVMDISEEEDNQLLKLNEAGEKENKIDLKKVEQTQNQEKVSEELKNEIFNDIAVKSISLDDK